MSTTQRLPILTPWRTLARMWVHFATRWELPTKAEAAYTRGVKAGEHVAEEKMRAWYRTAYESGYQQAVKDLPICHVQPAAQPAPLLGARARSLARQRLISAPQPAHDWINSKPPKDEEPAPEPKDPEDTEERFIAQLYLESRYGSRGKAS